MTTIKQEQPVLLIDIKEAARMLSLSKSEVYEMLNRGELRGTPRRPRRVLLASVYEWVKRMTEGA